MFDKYVSRWETNSAKWDEARDATGSDDVISLSVADMDFRTSPEIIQELVSFANHGIYGYSNISEKYISITQKWIKDQYDWDISKEWIVFIPRVVQTVSMLIQRETDIGDGIVIQSPSYSPLKNAIELNNREVLVNPLIYENNSYKMDFQDLENKFKQNAKMMILVSPHNPVGRVWDEDELTKLIHLCKKYEILLVSDEVHADFTWDKDFITVGKLLNDYDNAAICVQPGKTFNMPGLEVSNVIIKNKDLRDRFELYKAQGGIHNPQYFAVPALEKAYGESTEWLNLVRAEIKGNINFVASFLAENFPEFKLIKPEGTFTVWINYQESGLKEEDLKKIIYDNAKVAVGLGSNFGSEGKGFFRMNLALPKKRLEEAMNRILHAYNDWEGNNE